MKCRRQVWLWNILTISLLLFACETQPVQSSSASTTSLAAPLNLNAVNRRAPMVGLPDWSKAGYRAGMALPGSAAIKKTINATSFGVVANDGQDDSAALQAALDSVKDRAGASFDNLTLLRLPSGTINLSRQISVDVSYIVVRGQGGDPSSASATKIEFRPDANTRYDRLTADGHSPISPR